MEKGEHGHNSEETNSDSRDDEGAILEFEIIYNKRVLDKSTYSTLTTFRGQKDNQDPEDVSQYHVVGGDEEAGYGRNDRVGAVSGFRYRMERKGEVGTQGGGSENLPPVGRQLDVRGSHINEQY